MSVDTHYSSKKDEPSPPPSIQKVRLGIRLVLIQFLIVALCFIGWVIWYFAAETHAGFWIRVILGVAGLLSTLPGVVGILLCFFSAPERMIGKGHLVGALFLFLLVVLAQVARVVARLPFLLDLRSGEVPLVLPSSVSSVVSIWVFWLLGSILFVAFLLRLADFFDNDLLYNNSSDIVKHGILITIGIVLFAVAFEVWLVYFFKPLGEGRAISPAAVFLMLIPIVFGVLFYVVIFLALYFIVRSMRLFIRTREALQHVTDSQLEF